VLPFACLWVIPLPYGTMIAGMVCALRYVRPWERQTNRLTMAACGV
jgi:hypothetical protein